MLGHVNECPSSLGGAGTTGVDQGIETKLFAQQ